MIRDDWKFLHIGMIVRDTDKTCAFFGMMGFRVIRTFETPSKSPDNPRTSKIALIQKDAAVLEVIQPLEGTWINKDFLESVGEGVNHICFEVNDVEAETERMISFGFPVIYKVARGAYFDTRKVGNLMIELVRPAESGR